MRPCSGAKAAEVPVRVLRAAVPGFEVPCLCLCLSAHWLVLWAEGLAGQTAARLALPCASVGLTSWNADVYEPADVGVRDC